MGSDTQDAKLADTLLHTKAGPSQQKHVYASWACKGFLTTLLVTGIAALLLASNGIPTSTFTKEPVVFYNRSSTWRPPPLNLAATADEDYYWSRRKRDSQSTSWAPWTAPSDFTKAPTWTWKNELNEQVRHSPLIDNEMNIYIVTSSRVRKITSDGKLLWSWQTTPDEGVMCVSLTLYKGQVIGVTTAWPDQLVNRSVGFSLKMSDGSVNWKHVYPYGRIGDADAMSVFDGTMIFGARTNGSASPDLVLGASLADGSLLWEYQTDEIFWNFTPSYVGDGTFIFSSTCGQVQRLSLKGELIWKVGSSAPGQFCSEAGGALGPNGLFYAQWNKYHDTCTTGFWMPCLPILGDYDGRIAAYQVPDGSLVWERSLGRRTANYPAVGMLDGRLALILPVGDQPSIPDTPEKEKAALLAMPTPGYLTNAVWAMDATDGSMIWQSEEPKWPYFHGQYEDKAAFDKRPAWPPEDICLPDAQAIPLILGDGTVYAASSHGGWLRAIRDADGNGVIDPSEVSILSTGACFLNGPSSAPGMLVAASCWGDVHIFKS
mmetsp:Transcript_105271/g.191462  ORF Transcript_105271/g.191462 Transcript_105271/m.191462 type:complete len:545 (+) Transcript_105271:104-1738(+)